MAGGNITGTQVSFEDLDGILGLTFDASQFEGVTFQSWTPLQIPGELGIDTMTVAATGEPAPGHSIRETVTVTAVDDQQNQVTLDFGPYQITEYVIGLSSSSILLSQEPLTEAWLDLGGVAPNNGIPASVNETLEPTTGFLTNEPAPAGTTMTFASSGSATILPGQEALSAYDTTTNASVLVSPTQYSGPVAGLNEEYISPSSDSLDFYANTPGWFIKGGPGATGITVDSGINVLDSGAGSAFMIGGTGTDLFFFHANGLTTNTWSSVVNFHPSDSVTFWGVTPTDFSIQWLDNAGHLGANGLTLVVSAPNQPEAAVTLGGFGLADLTNGRLSVSFQAGQASQPPALYIHENS